MDAFEEIVKDRSSKIYYFLRRMGLTHEDADGIVDDVFILFWRDLQSGHGLNTVNFRLFQHAITKVHYFLNGLFFDQLNLIRRDFHSFRH